MALSDVVITVRLNNADPAIQKLKQLGRAASDIAKQAIPIASAYSSAFAKVSKTFTDVGKKMQSLGKQMFYLGTRLFSSVSLPLALFEFEHSAL